MGSRPFAEFQTCVQGYLHLTELGDAPGALTPALITEYLTEAAVEHSRYRPRKVTDATLDGTGSLTEFRLDTLTAPFEEEFSDLTAVEYPTGSTPPAFLEKDTDWSLARNSSGQPVVRFASAPVNGTNNIRLEYVARHTLTAASNTVLDADFYAVCHLAAAAGLLSMAGRAAHRVQPSITVDDGGPRTQSDVYRAVAKEHRAQYFAHFGISEKDAGQVGAASGTRDWDSVFSHGAPWLTHHWRTR